MQTFEITPELIKALEEIEEQLTKPASNNTHTELLLNKQNLLSCLWAEVKQQRGKR